MTPSPLHLVRNLPEGGEEHGIGPAPVPVTPLGVVNQDAQVVCLVAAGCQFPEPCAVACWLGKR